MDRRLLGVTLLLAVTQIVGWGTTFYLPGIIGRDIAADLGVSTGFVYAGVTVMVVTSAVLSPMAGRALDRYGTRWFMAAGSALLAVGLMVLAVSRDPILYLLGWAIIGVATVLALSLPATTTLAHVAGAKARRAMIGLMLFTGLSSSIVWPLTAVLEPILGWRGTCLVYAAVHLFVCLPLHAFGLPAARLGVTGGKDPAVDVGGAVEEAYAPRAFLAVAAAFSLAGFVSWGLSLNIIELLQAGGLAESTAIALGSAMGLMQVGARVVEFTLGQRASPIVPALLATGLLPVSFLLLFFAGISPAFAVAYLVAYAVATGLIAVARATLPLWLFGAAVYGAASGRLMFAQNVAFGVAPVAFAAAMDAGLEVAVGLAFISATAAFAAMVWVAVTPRRTSS